MAQEAHLLWQDTFPIPAHYCNSDQLSQCRWGCPDDQLWVDRHSDIKAVVMRACHEAVRARLEIWKSIMPGGSRFVPDPQPDPWEDVADEDLYHPPARGWLGDDANFVT